LWGAVKCALAITFSAWCSTKFDSHNYSPGFTFEGSSELIKP
jgi:hypothetical protein